MSVETLIYKSPFATVNYTFEGGYPIPDTARAIYDEADLNRAVQAYRFFYPSVSGLALFEGNVRAGAVANQVFGVLDARPRHLGFTLNSDTPYGNIPLDLHAGPMLLELPPGPLLGTVLDLNQRWIADFGLGGLDAGQGGQYVLLPPGYEGASIPSGPLVVRSSTFRTLVGVRALPLNGDTREAVELIRAIKVRPVEPPAGFAEPIWIDMSTEPQDTTPLVWENDLGYWEALHTIIETEPAQEPFRSNYGELAALGLAKGRSFDPDVRMKRILIQAARLGNALMRVQAFADRRPERLVFGDRLWEWVGLTPSSGSFETANFTDLVAREAWFFQATGASPSRLLRKHGESSALYWLGLRDTSGAYLDGGKSYKLVIPTPVPCLFWSVTVYDAQTRSQIETTQGKAALRSQFELIGKEGASSLELHFGPEPPPGKERPWIKTLPRKGWFAYLRLYGLQKPALSGNWKPGDFEQVRF